MGCVFEGSSLPNGFEEQLEYSPEMPYTISVKRFLSEDIVPLHYADTIEILLCDQLCGQLTIDNQSFSLSGRQLFVIPPYTVHGNHILPCTGSMHVVKVSFQEIGHYVNLTHYLESCGCQTGQLAYACPEYDEADRLIRLLIMHDGSIARCLPHLLELFLLLSRHTVPDRSVAAPRFKASSLQELISWTQTHYAERITIDQAAKLTGYSKYHFCTRFKSLTGMTYLSYLNSVRISHACLMLRDGQAISSVCRECGYDNVSYFTQVFRRIKHMTPKQYIDRNE